MIDDPDLHAALLVTALLIAAMTVTRNVAYLVRMWRQPRRLLSERTAIAARSKEDDRPFELHFVVPAYQEVDALPATFSALQRSIERSSYRARVTVVTSITDESPAPDGVCTRAVAERLCADFPGSRVVVDPSPAPSMASAFNFGIRTIAAEAAGAEPRVYVVAYNADSTASPDSVCALGDAILANDFPQVLQLNHSSLRNAEQMRGASGWYALGAAYYQTRWALGFEFDLHRRNSAPARSGPLGHSYHLKGHGLVLRLDRALSLDGLSTHTPCEDLELGFRLSLHDVPVVPVPVLEDTESPSTAVAVTAQKRYWFSGMADVVNFHRLHPELREKSAIRYELQRAASLYRSAGCFVLAPVPYWFLAVSGILLGQAWLAGIPVLSAALGVALIRRTLRRLGTGHPRLRAVEFVTIPSAVLVWSLTRNVGPLLYLVSVLRSPDRSKRLRAVQRRHIEESASTQNQR
ncbi:hypothetical protein ABH923_003908 [Leifsonia sp. EB41]|uniref:hypothetical protein n=1 Tax=Leifsonia sp. EB41 TaxID=3156260 RepID=UPI0035119B6E